MAGHRLNELDSRSDVNPNGLRFALIIDRRDGIAMQAFGFRFVVDRHRLFVERCDEFTIAIYVVALRLRIALDEGHVVEHKDADVVFPRNVVDGKIFGALRQVGLDVLEFSATYSARFAHFLEVLGLSVGRRIEYVDLFRKLLRLALIVVDPEVDLLRLA